MPKFGDILSIEGSQVQVLYLSRVTGQANLATADGLHALSRDTFGQDVEDAVGLVLRTEPRPAMVDFITKYYPLYGTVTLTMDDEAIERSVV